MLEGSANDATSLVCLHCRASLRLTDTSDHIACSACDRTYPLIAGKIPVFMADPARYLAKLYLGYERHLRQENAEIERIAAQAKERRGRSDLLARMQTAIQHNCQYMRSVQRSLAAHVSVADLANGIGGEEPIGYLTGWEYLRRDWCWLPEGEEELAVIKRFVLDALGGLGADIPSILVTGAATARLAWDLRDKSRCVYALDNSFTMAHQFHELLERDISFYEINRNNVFKAQEVVRILTASSSPPGDTPTVAAREKRFRYLVGDGLNVPLASQSVSAIVSVYFTDLVPPTRYLEEIKRLLKPGGLFIHFGPLEYQLPDMNDVLSAEEIRTLFTENSFELLSEGRIRTSHLASAVSMHAKIYDVWTFAAVNRESAVVAAPNEVAWTSVVLLVNEVGYQTKGCFSRDGERLLEATMILPSGERYEGAIPVLEILRAVDGARTNQEVVEILGEKYDCSGKAARERVLEVLRMLVEKKVLRVVQPPRRTS